MAKNATQAIKMLARIGFNLESISTPPNMVYKVLHKARPLIYLPLAAVDNNVQFMLDTSQKFIQTTDGMVLEVQRADVVNIITAKDEIEPTTSNLKPPISNHKNGKSKRILQILGGETPSAETS